MDIGGNNLLNTLHTMKALLLYIAIGCVAINVAGNAIQGSARNLQEVQNNRSAQLCQVSAQYCS